MPKQSKNISYPLINGVCTQKAIVESNVYKIFIDFDFTYKIYLRII